MAQSRKTTLSISFSTLQCFGLLFTTLPVSQCTQWWLWMDGDARHGEKAEIFGQGIAQAQLMDMMVHAMHGDTWQVKRDERIGNINGGGMPKLDQWCRVLSDGRSWFMETLGSWRVMKELRDIPSRKWQSSINYNCTSLNFNVWWLEKPWPEPPDGLALAFQDCEPGQLESRRGAVNFGLAWPSLFGLGLARLTASG